MVSILSYSCILFFFIIECDASINGNGTGATFPGTIFSRAAFAYLFEQSNGDKISFVQAGATAGKCNIMGYWNTGNAGSGQPTLQQVRDTYICSDSCTGSQTILSICGNNSLKYPRFDRLTRNPIVDYGVVTSKLTTTDRKAFPDLQSLPAVAGAVVIMYNIPELVSASATLVLSRASISKIFRGTIKFWNDYRIVNDNTGSAQSILRTLNQTIHVVVRADSAGQSQIFSTALSSFDPCCVSTPDYSFAAMVGANERPKWCGPLTDEIQTLTITGCSTSVTGLSRTVQLFLIGLDYNLHNISFDCNASAESLKNKFESIYQSPSIITKRYDSIRTDGTPYHQYQIGYWYNSLHTKNWYEPIIIKQSTSTINITINTLQEGGYWNSHYNSSAYTVTTEIQSIWISNLFKSTFQLSYSKNAKSTLIHLTSGSTSSNIATILKNTINNMSPGLVLSVAYISRKNSSSTWKEYQIKFNVTSPATLVVHTTNISQSHLIFVTTLLQGNNYPFFYDSSHPMGYSGSGKYTCYRNEDLLAPWSYYTGWNAGGVTAQIEFLPYSIGYGLVEDAKSLSLPKANLINRAGQIISASADSVSVAVMEKGGNLDSYLYADLTDGTSQYVWPIVGFSYFVIRTNAHLGDCTRRRAAMRYLHNFYTSATVSNAATQLSMSSLPQYVKYKVMTTLINVAKCSNGEYALPEYHLSSSTLLGTAAMSDAVSVYLSVYTAIDSSFSWDYSANDDSSVTWENYIQNSDNYVGIFTLFPSKVAKKRYYQTTTSESITITAFAHVAVVPIYHLNGFSAKSTLPLRLSADILAGIYSGKIIYWNDTSIQNANSANKQYLPNSRILVVGRSGANDVNALFSLSLSKHSTYFQSVYNVTEEGLLTIPFLTQLSQEYTYLVNSDDEVDSAVTRYDGSIGYFLQVGSPGSTVAYFCLDVSCNTVINPTNISTISACVNDPTTLFSLSSLITTYDLLSSTAEGCYPIVGTIDYGTLATSNMPSCSGGEDSGFAYKRVRFSSWLFNGSLIDQSLESLTVSSTSTLVRAKGYENICNIECDSTYLGYSYCNYRTCSWSSGDYQQVVNPCHAASLTRLVTYELLTDAACISKDIYYPSKRIVCDFAPRDSAVGIFCYTLSAIGALICMILLFLIWKNRNERIMRWAQPVFMYISLFGSMSLNLSIIAFIGANSSVSCIARPWLVGISSTVMFAPLLMKLHRVDLLMNTKKLRKMKITDANVLRNVCILCLVDIIILVLWTALYRPVSVTVSVTYSGLYNTVDDTLCRQGSTRVFIILLVVYKVFLIVFGIAKAVSTWKVKADISDAKQFAVAIYNITVVGGIIYAMVQFLSFSATVLVILKAIGLFFCSSISAAIIVVPKLVSIHNNVEIPHTNETNSDPAAVDQPHPAASGSHSGTTGVLDHVEDDEKTYMDGGSGHGVGSSSNIEHRKHHHYNAIYKNPPLSTSSSTSSLPTHQHHSLTLQPFHSFAIPHPHLGTKIETESSPAENSTVNSTTTSATTAFKNVERRTMTNKPKARTSIHNNRTNKDEVQIFSVPELMSGKFLGATQDDESFDEF